MSLAGSYRKSPREKVPSSRCDLSFTGICGAIPFSSTSQFSIGAAPYAVSAASRSGLRPKRSSVRSIMVLAAPTSAWRMAREASTSTMTPNFTSMRVVGVREERWPLVSPGPLRRRIGWRDKLRDDVAGGAPGCIIERCQILLHRTAGPRGIAIPAPILPRDRALLVGVGLDQARIDCKAFAPNQTGRNARLDDTFKHVAKNIPLAKTLVAGTRKCRMIRDSLLDTEPAEPAIGQVHLHFTADQPLRADRKDIPHDQHPDHQLRID